MLIIPQYKTFLCTLLAASWILRSSSLAGGIISNSVWTPCTIIYNSFVWFFLQPHDFPHLHPLINTLLLSIQEWHLQNTKVTFLVAIFSLIFCFSNSKHILLFRLSCTTHTRNYSGSTSMLLPWKSCQVSKLGFLHLFFLFLRNHCVLSHEVQYLENYCFIYFILFLVVCVR